MSIQWHNKRQILALLSSDHFVSGEQLAQELAISRSAIQQQIEAMGEFGIDIYSVKGKGYKLATPICLLDETQLLQQLSNRCFYFNDIPSTNAFMLTHGQELKSGDICLAEYQSAGRGRRGRQWLSPYGHHIYASLYWRLEQGMPQAMGLSLVVACSIVTVLKQMGVSGLGLKWPNDIYLNDKKLAGILIELINSAEQACQLVIGFGINMSMSASQGELIDQPWSDLSTLESMPDKTELVIAVHKQLKQDLKRFEAAGLKDFIDAWQADDIFMGREVSLLMAPNEVTGIYKGIDEQGAVLLQTAQGLQAFVGGEISLRATNKMA
ncbi:Biotin--acetyl-CoA-carboxylase ligase [Shewanella denitrificans OS217]|jgi:BirA family transcriptional regulator, biotin operon repressor / biotin---[acetyl-CoA-carboxylase] ligase|uniref:Bifunctional ligase/repressor BirA n=1 Tax=Shewanella denitrificans (strain OS217 / ATCC BAA-1090 / DSM 15013) TaxID=318161 RepID=Q12SX5_SHEDO|nr:bifunctional biotin--[acetyl-CoA-carboxylase] ligase/biotin operon repressor BirA [Shewanella denitrificans]ABE53451.1 Biotin--acetyl-CoA-carboxylase ligase [Shewanella denitrificans OS217]